MLRFDNHTFEPDTGELVGPLRSVRLQPKPARLLEMLLQADGELVEREQIRPQLWPDTNVDFDASLNTCVRQIRTALRESGGEIEYVETLPKRGYRIAVAVQGDTRHAVLPDPAPPSAARLAATASVPYVLTFIVLAVGTAIVLWVELFGDAATPPGEGATPGSKVGDSAIPGTSSANDTATTVAPVRLAVVPFVDPASDANATFNRDLTEAFVTALVNAVPSDIVVIGPSTTAQFVADGATLPDVAAAVNADFVLYGGHRSSADIFFVEVLRPDGAHLYAQRLDLDLGTPAEAPPEVVAAMTASMLEALGR